MIEHFKVKPFDLNESTLTIAKKLEEVIDALNTQTKSNHNINTCKALVKLDDLRLDVCMAELPYSASWNDRITDIINLLNGDA